MEPAAHACADQEQEAVVPLVRQQDRAEPRKVVSAEQPPARRSPIADDALARVPGSFGPMARKRFSVEQIIMKLREAEVDLA